MKKVLCFVLSLLLLLSCATSYADTYSLLLLESDLLQTEELDYPATVVPITEIPQFSQTPLMPTDPAYTMMILEYVIEHGGYTAPVTENLLATLESDEFQTFYQQAFDYSMTYQTIVDKTSEAQAEEFGPLLLLLFPTYLEYTVFDTETNEDTCSVAIALYSDGLPVLDRLFCVHMVRNESYISGAEISDWNYGQHPWEGEGAYYWIDGIEITDIPIPTTADDYIGTWEFTHAIDTGYKEISHISSQAIRDAGISFHFILEINEDFTYSIKYNDLRNMAVTSGCWTWTDGVVNLDSNEQLNLRRDAEMLLLSISSGDFIYYFSQAQDTDTTNGSMQQLPAEGSTYHIEEAVPFLTEMRQYWISLSPDGNYALAIASHDDEYCIIVHNTKTDFRAPILLDETDESHSSICRAISNPDFARLFRANWSPDGRYAVLSYNRDEMRGHIFSPCLVDVEQLTITTLPMIMEEVDCPCATQAAFSPDGKTIYYACQPLVPSKSIVCAYNVTSGETNILYSGKQEVDGTKYYITGPSLVCLSDDALLHIITDRKSTYLGLATRKDGTWKHSVLPIDEYGSAVVANQLFYNHESGYGIIDAFVATDGTLHAQKGAGYIFSIAADGSQYFSYLFEKKDHEFFKILQSPNGSSFIYLGVKNQQPAHYQLAIQGNQISEKSFDLPLDIPSNRIALQPGLSMNQNYFGACGLWGGEYLMLGCDSGVCLFEIVAD